MKITAAHIFNLFENDLKGYQLNLAYWNGYEQPLDLYLQDWNKWVGWNQWRGNKNDFDRQYVFCLIKIPHESNKWLFGGIFRVVKRLEDWADTEIGYELELVDLHKELIGRLIIDFCRLQGTKGRAFLLEEYYKDFVISEILKKPFNGI